MHPGFLQAWQDFTHELIGNGIIRQRLEIGLLQHLLGLGWNPNLPWPLPDQTLVQKRREVKPPGLVEERLPVAWRKPFQKMEIRPPADTLEQEIRGLFITDRTCFCFQQATDTGLLLDEIT